MSDVTHPRPDDPLPPELDPRGRHHVPVEGRGARAGRARQAARVLSSLVSASLVIYLGVLWSKVHNLDSGVQRIRIDVAQGPAQHGSATGAVNGNAQNILIVGNDDRTGMSRSEIRLLKTGKDGGLDTDVMMIVHVPADGSKATLISLPRDSYVAIPGYGMSKLNSAYSDGYEHSSGGHNAKVAAGANLLYRTIYNLTGVYPDHFVQVGLIGFYRIAKAIGKIPVNLCESVDDTHAYNESVHQDGGSGFKMSKGHHELNAVQALEFVRQRHHFALGDLERVERQRYFLTAAFRRVASAHILLDPTRLGDLVQAIHDSIFVDQSLNILELAKQLSDLSANNITGSTIPYVRFQTIPGVGAVNIVDPAQVRRKVSQLLDSGTPAYTSAKRTSPGNVTVRVLNAGSSNGAAGTATRTLVRAGFHARVDTTEPHRSSTTTITYPKGDEAQAKTLAAYVPGAQVSQSTTAGVTLTLGSDGVSARSTPKRTAGRHKVIDAGCIH